MSHPYFVHGAKPSVLGHRGFVSADDAAAGIVENSRAAVTAALAAGADYVESDCHLTSDGEVVLFHDPDLTRTLGDRRRITEVALGELDALMRTRGGLLTLEAAYAEFPDLRLNLAVKSQGGAVPAGRVGGALGPERTLLTSFSERARLAALAAAREAAAAAGRDVVDPATSAGQGRMVRILAAVALRSRSLLDRAFAGIDALQIPERFGVLRVLSPALLRAAHERGVEVHVWTINDAETMQRLAPLGVDGIVTDRTDLAIRTLRAAS